MPFGPGSGTDSATRIVAQHLGAALTQPVTTDNRPGASRVIAASAVAQCAPDGYTLMMGTNSTHGANPGLITKLPYDPLRDFVPIGLVGIFSSFLVVNPALPVRTPAELVTDGKANPQTLSFASGNTSSLISRNPEATASACPTRFAAHALQCQVHQTGAAGLLAPELGYDRDTQIRKSVRANVRREALGPGRRILSARLTPLSGSQSESSDDGSGSLCRALLSDPEPTSTAHDLLPRNGPSGPCSGTRSGSRIGRGP